MQKWQFPMCDSSRPPDLSGCDSTPADSTSLSDTTSTLSQRLEAHGLAHIDLDGCEVSPGRSG